MSGFGCSNYKTKGSNSCYESHKLIGTRRIKIKNILRVEFKDNKKYRRQVKSIKPYTAWHLITDYDDNRYVLESHVLSVRIDRNINLIKVGEEYYIKTHDESNYIEVIMDANLEFAKSILENIEDHDINDIALVYKYRDYISTPYKVSLDFGYKMRNMNVHRNISEEDLAYCMGHLLDEHLKDRCINKNISVYDGESKENIIKIRKDYMEDIVGNEINWDYSFDIFSKELGRVTDESRYFLRRYED
ncbi:MAG: hypothetical protein ACRCX2_35975 [Paraclostridium sp.]